MKLCKIINDITGKVAYKNMKTNEMKGNLLYDSISICNKFNYFFVNVGKYIEKNIVINNYDVYN